MSIESESFNMGGSKNFFSVIYDDSIEYVRKYNKNYIIVGERLIGFQRVGKQRIPKVELYGFDLTTGVRITLIGLVGAGKTWVLRALMERVWKSGEYAVANLTDVKAEMCSSIDPAPLSQTKYYNTGEKPQGVPVMTFKPLFFKTFQKFVPNTLWRRPLGFRVSDISYSDIKEIFNIEDLPDLQKAFVMDLAFEIQKGRKRLNTVEDFYKEIELSELNVVSKSSLRLKLRSFFSIGFFDEPAYDPVDILNKGYIFNLDLEFFDSVDKKGGAPQLAVAVIQRKIVDGRKENKLIKKRVFMILDEANRFLPKDRETSVKTDTFENVEVTRAYGISMCFAYQTIGSVPQQIFDNSRYILVPCRAPVDVFVEAYRSTGIFRGHFNQVRRHVSHIKSQMRAFDNYSWLCFDRESGSENIIRFFSPLSRHDKKN